MPQRDFPSDAPTRARVSAHLTITVPTSVRAEMVVPGYDHVFVTFGGGISHASLMDTPERLADMLRFALDEVTALLPADTPPPAEPVPYFRRPVPFDIGDEADIDTVTEADWDDVLTDRFGGEAA